MSELLSCKSARGVTCPACCGMVDLPQRRLLMTHPPISIRNVLCYGVALVDVLHTITFFVSRVMDYSTHTGNAQAFYAIERCSWLVEDTLMTPLTSGFGGSD
jgi:hypothetical protein